MSSMDPCLDANGERRATIQGTDSDNDAAIERLIDRTSLARVLDSVARVCSAKAEHVLTNWQDRPLAGTWARASAAVDKLAARGVINDAGH